MQQFIESIASGSVFSRRAVAFFIDTAIGCVLSCILSVIGAFIHPQYGSLAAMFIGITLIICRDAFGKSPGKALMRLTVIDVRTQKRAAFLKRILRQLTTPLWMIEAVVCLVCNGIRITDFWLSTKVAADQELCNLQQ